MADYDDFSKHPESLGERRAKKNWDAKDWTPRDAIVDVLRRIDTGELEPDAVVVCIREKSGREGVRTSFAAAGVDSHVALGLLEATKFRIWEKN